MVSFERVYEILCFYSIPWKLQVCCTYCQHFVLQVEAYLYYETPNKTILSSNFSRVVVLTGVIFQLFQIMRHDMSLYESIMTIKPRTKCTDWEILRHQHLPKNIAVTTVKCMNVLFAGEWPPDTKWDFTKALETKS